MNVRQSHRSNIWQEIELKLGVEEEKQRAIQIEGAGKHNNVHPM